MHHMDVPMDYHLWGTMVEHYQRHMPKLANVMSSWKTAFLTIQNDLLHEFINKTICIIVQLISVVCCCNWWAVTLRTVCEKRVIYRHLTVMTETFELLMKSCKKLICYSCIFNVQLHVYLKNLKKWTLKFKLRYLRNYLRYFNKICRISCVNTFIKSPNVLLKSILPWLKYSIFFIGIVFLLAHLYMRSALYTVVIVDHYIIIIIIKFFNKKLSNERNFTNGEENGVQIIANNNVYTKLLSRNVVRSDR